MVRLRVSYLSVRKNLYKLNVYRVISISLIKMMHLNAKDCETYYCSQVGGGGLYFQGVPHQRGAGFFQDLTRYVSPILLRAGKYLGRQFLQTGKNVVTDVASGSSFRDATQNRLRETSRKIKDDFFQKFQSGKGIKRKRNNRKTQTKAKRSKRSHKDIFS